MGGALAQGYARLEAEALAQRIAAMERVDFRGDKMVAEAPGERAGAEFDRTLALLRDWRRSASGAGTGRAPTRWDFDAAFAELDRKLAMFRERALRDGSSTSSAPRQDERQ